MENNNTENLQTDLLANDVDLEISPYDRMASSGKRLVNYLIDVIGFYTIMFIIGIVLGAIAPNEVAEYSMKTDTSMGYKLLDSLISMCLYALYMSLVEGFSKGRSLGKLITNTQAVNADGSTLNFSQAFARGFSRIVPFEAFSGLGSPCHPWHDRWTDTVVIYRD